MVETSQKENEETDKAEKVALLSSSNGNTGNETSNGNGVNATSEDEEEATKTLTHECSCPHHHEHQVNIGLEDKGLQLFQNYNFYNFLKSMVSKKVDRGLAT